jgi:hypothetical protein
MTAPFKNDDDQRRVPAFALFQIGELRLGRREVRRDSAATASTPVSGFPPLPKTSARLAEARFAREGDSRTLCAGLAITQDDGRPRSQAETMMNLGALGVTTPLDRL